MHTLLWKSDRVKPARWEYAVLAAIFCLIVLLAVLGTIVSGRSKEPIKVSDQFVYSLLSNNADAAYELTAEPFKQTTSDETFATVAERFSTNLRTDPTLASSKIERSPTGALLATVEYDIPGTTGSRLVVKLVKENKSWRVLNINNAL